MNWYCNCSLLFSGIKEYLECVEGSKAKVPAGALAFLSSYGVS